MLLGHGFTFAASPRRELARCLSSAGVDLAAIPEIENAVDTFRILLASQRATKESAEKLRRLAEASEQFLDALAPTGAAHSIVVASAWEPTAWRAVQGAAWGALVRRRQTT